MCFDDLGLGANFAEIRASELGAAANIPTPLGFHADRRDANQGRQFIGELFAQSCDGASEAGPTDRGLVAVLHGRIVLDLVERHQPRAGQGRDSGEQGQGLPEDSHGTFDREAEKHAEEDAEPCARDMGDHVRAFAHPEHGQ